MIAAIAGAAVRTPLGRDAREIASRLQAGERARPPEPGGVIPDAPAGGRHRRFLDRLGLHALETGLEALSAAGPFDPGLERVGLFVGTPGLRPRWDEMSAAFSEPDGGGPWADGLGRLHPFWMLQHLSNNVHALLSMDAGIHGEGATFGGGVSGAEALLAAARALEAGAVDAALVLAYDGDATGCGPGEAAAAVVLERPGKAVGAARIEVATGVDGAPLPSGEPRAEAVARIASGVSPCERIVDARATAWAFGNLGAATAVVQVAVWLELLRRGLVQDRSVLLLATSTPGLASAVRLEVP